MKSKKLNKKLHLTKTTISDLNGQDMHHIQGGIPLSYYTNCASCLETGCCPTMTNRCNSICSGVFCC